VPFFAQLPAGRLIDIAQVLRRRPVSRGTEVVSQGDKGDAFYIIGEGHFQVLVDGVPQQELGPGDYFGERALLGDGGRAATVLSESPGLVFSMDERSFRQHVERDLATTIRLQEMLAFRNELAAMPLFDGLSRVELDLLLSRLVPISVEAGTTIFAAGDPGDRFYIIRSGTIEAITGDRVVSVMGPGQPFGEVALIARVPRTLTIRAAEPSRLLYLEADDFYDVLVQYCGRASTLQELSHVRLQQHNQLGRIGSPAAKVARPG
jgi:cAMP-dependent protein kinase regulator